VPAPNSDRVASDDVVARDHPRQRLGPAPLVRVDRRLRRDRILLERTDAHAEAPVVFDREADEGPRPDAVRGCPVFRQRYAETRIPELLDLTRFELHTYRHTSVDVDMCSGCIRPCDGCLPQAGQASGRVVGQVDRGVPDAANRSQTDPNRSRNGGGPTDIRRWARSAWRQRRARESSVRYPRRWNG